MPTSTLARLAPLTGIAAVVLTVVMVIVVGEPPDVDKSTAEVVAYWDDTKHIVGAVLLMLAGALLVWFGGSVRAMLRQAEGEPGRLAAVAFGGFVILGLGFAAFAGFEFAAAETAGDVPGEVTHTLATLDAYFFFPAALGQFLALLATAVVVLRHGGLPRWLAYAAIVIAIVLITPLAFAGVVAMAIWIVIVSILLYRHAGAPAPGPAAASPPPET